LGTFGDEVVVLRPFRVGDVPAVTAACQDREINRWTSAIPWPYTEAHARNWISTHPRQVRAQIAFPWAVTDADTGELLGSCGLHDVDRAAQRCEVGYWVASWARRRGVATHAVSLVTQRAFSVLGIVQIDLLTMLDNVASEGVARGAGYGFVEIVSGVPSALDPTVTFDARRWSRTSDGRAPAPSSFSNRASS
jgi:RimJ/RimL family protein N-acetyltransferase